MIHDSDDAILCIPYILHRHLYWNPTSNEAPAVFEENENGYWRSMAYRSNGEVFYLSFSYIENKNAFVIYTFFANVSNGNIQYKVKMFMEQVETLNPERLYFEGNVLQIQDVKNVSLAQDLPTDCYWIVPKEVITIYQAYRKNDVDDFYTCNVPIYIEHIIQVESGDQVSNGIDDQSDLEVD